MSAKQQPMSEEDRRRREAMRRKKLKKQKKMRKMRMLRAAIISLMILFVLLLVLVISFFVRFFTGNVTLSGDATVEEIEKSATFIGLDLVTDSRSASVTKYGTYGVSFNIEGTFTLNDGESLENAYLYLVDAYDTQVSDDEEETETETESSGLMSNFYSITTTVNEDGSISFANYEEINNGMILETTSTGSYVALLRVKLTDGSVVYYTLNDSSSCDAVDYYTLTKNDTNQHIEISFQTDGNTDLNYLYFTNETVSELPDDVYDIVIDPGHGGLDTGASSSSGVTESELTLSYGKELKTYLESLGYKVLITRDGSESADADMAYTMYDEDGRVNVACASNAKICFCIHFNSNSEVTSGGIEIYCSGRADTTLAELVADTLVSDANTYYSNQKTYKLASGVYARTYTEDEIASMDQKAIENDFEPYENLTTDTDYLFMIRELGGIWTNAYIDGRNPYYGENLYRNSNQGVETLLCELGYMSVSSDLKNCISNQTAYVEAMGDALQAWLDSLE